MKIRNYLEYVAYREKLPFCGTEGNYQYFECPSCGGDRMNVMPETEEHPKSRYYCFKCSFCGDADDLLRRTRPDIGENYHYRLRKNAFLDRYKREYLRGIKFPPLSPPAVDKEQLDAFVIDCAQRGIEWPFVEVILRCVIGDMR